MSSGPTFHIIHTENAEITLNCRRSAFYTLRAIIPVLSAMALVMAACVPGASAQSQSVGVDREGTWHVGEGLEYGDYFHYTVCHVDYKECKDFEFEMWIRGDVMVGAEEQWLAEVLVREGSGVAVGNMTLGKTVTVPTGGSPELGAYTRMFGSSVTWLSAFATAETGSGERGPKAFSDPSWGGEVRPVAAGNVTVPAGMWDAVKLSLLGIGPDYAWVADGFPFPIKSVSYFAMSDIGFNRDYEFVLRGYAKDVWENPFRGIIPTDYGPPSFVCGIDTLRTVAIKNATAGGHYRISASYYGPGESAWDCKMAWSVQFFDQGGGNERLDGVWFDFLVVDDSQNPIRSIAQERGKPFLYARYGYYNLDMAVMEDPGTVNYAVWVYGMVLGGEANERPRDFLIMPVTIFPNDEDPRTPPWVKPTAGLWADGTLGDAHFARIAHFLEATEMMRVPPEARGDGEVVPWLKRVAELWADGAIDDDAFVMAVQFLVEEGLVRVPPGNWSGPGVDGADAGP